MNAKCGSLSHVYHICSWKQITPFRKVAIENSTKICSIKSILSLKSVETRSIHNIYFCFYIKNTIAIKLYKSIASFSFFTKWSFPETKRLNFESTYSKKNRAILHIYLLKMKKKYKETKTRKMWTSSQKHWSSLYEINSFYDAMK